MFIDVKFFESNDLDLAQITRLCYELEKGKALSKYELIFRIRFVKSNQDLIEI